MLEIIGLVLAVPLLLMVLMLALGRLEESVVAPEERAAALTELIASPRAPEDVERAAAQMLAQVVPLHREEARADVPAGARHEVWSA